MRGGDPRPPTPPDRTGSGIPAKSRRATSIYYCRHPNSAHIRERSSRNSARTGLGVGLHDLESVILAASAPASRMVTGAGDQHAVR